MIVHSVWVPVSDGHLLAKTVLWSVGVCGSHAELTRSFGNSRSIVATRRVATSSRSVIPFQIPQMFSQLSSPVPLKNAESSRSILLVDQRSLTCTVWRGSSHLLTLTMGTAASFVQ